MTRTAAPCLLCRGAAPLRFRSGEHGIHRCHACDLEFVWPIPAPEVLAKVYARGYFAGHGAGYEDYFGAERAISARKADARLDALAALGLRSGALLDVGCAAGYFLQAARARGFDVYGVEPSPEARGALAGDLAPRVAASLDAVRARAPFDVVTLWDVLEHLPDPAAALAELEPLLRPGGVLAVVVPVLGSINTRVAPRTWDQYKPPEHLWYFSRRSLLALLRRTTGAEHIHTDVAWERRRRFTPEAIPPGAFARARATLDGALGACARILRRDLVVDSLAAYARIPARP